MADLSSKDKVGVSGGPSVADEEVDEEIDNEVGDDKDFTRKRTSYTASSTPACWDQHSNIKRNGQQQRHAVANIKSA